MKVLNEIKHIFTKSGIKTFLPISLIGIVIGLFIGTIVWAYTALFEYLSEIGFEIYGLVREHLWCTPLLFLGLIALAFISYFAIKYLSLQGSGCGIPYAEAQMKGRVSASDKKGLKLLCATFICSICSLFAGVPLDGEGASAKMGGVISELSSNVISKKVKHGHALKSFMVTSGASAALASVSNAPLTGIMFALEEGHRKFSSTIFISTTSSVIAAVFMKRIWVYTTHVGESIQFLFDNKLNGMIPFSQIWMLLLVGLVIGLASALFNLLADKVNDYFRDHKVNILGRLISLFIIIGVVGLTLRDALFAGTGLIENILEGHVEWSHALIVFVVRFFLVILAIALKGTGGLFMPTLALGALLGYLLGYSFTFMGMDPIYIPTIVTISMTAFFASVVRAPLTGILLIVELTGEVLTGFFETGLVILIVIVIAEIFNTIPIYDSLIDDNLEIEREGKELKEEFVTKVVEEGAFIEGRQIRDILWPHGTTILKIEKGHKDSQFFNGENEIHHGDKYYLNIKSYELDVALKQIDELFDKL